MVVFFVGPDGTGKTEISTALANFLKIPRFKVNTEKLNWENGSFKNSLAFDAILPQFVKSLSVPGHDQMTLSFISDRGYPCEWVYSQVFGRETDFSVIERIDEEWSQMECVIVFCLRKNYLDVRDDDLVPKEKIGEIHDKYLEFFKKTKCKKIKFFVDDFMHPDKKTFNLNAQVEFLTKRLIDRFQNK